MLAATGVSNRPGGGILHQMRYIVLLTALVSSALRPADPIPPAVLLPRAVLASMSAAFTNSNQHWNELEDLNTLTQMLGTVKPTQREFLGCLQGEVMRDTLLIQGWAPARHMKQLQFAVTGDCDGLPGFVGTFHTHPYRADLQNLPLKERSLSRQDLETFAAAPDLVTMAVWDADSVDAAIKDSKGGIVHPATVILR